MLDICELTLDWVNQRRRRTTTLSSRRPASCSAAGNKAAAKPPARARSQWWHASHSAVVGCIHSVCALGNIAGQVGWRAFLILDLLLTASQQNSWARLSTNFERHCCAHRYSADWVIRRNRVLSALPPLAYLLCPWGIRRSFASSFGYFGHDGEPWFILTFKSVPIENVIFTFLLPVRIRR